MTRRYSGGYRFFLPRGYFPVTKTVLFIAGISFLLGLILPVLQILNWNSLLILRPDNILTAPWSLGTYPFINSDFFSLLFAGLWLWFIGGGLEGSCGGKRYVVLFTAVTIVTGVAMALAGKLVMIPVAISGLWLPLTGLTWAWGLANPEQELLFWGIVPVQARWLSWIEAAIIFFTYLPYHLLIALASLSGVAVAYLFPRHGGGLYKRNRFSLKNWLGKRRQEARRKKFRVIH